MSDTALTGDACLTGNASLIGKPKYITHRINLISQTIIFQKEKIPTISPLGEKSLHGITSDPGHIFHMTKFFLFPRSWTTSLDGINWDDAVWLAPHYKTKVKEICSGSPIPPPFHVSVAVINSRKMNLKFKMWHLPVGDVKHQGTEAKHTFLTWLSLV